MLYLYPCFLDYKLQQYLCILSPHKAFWASSPRNKYEPASTQNLMRLLMFFFFCFLSMVSFKYSGLLKRNSSLYNLDFIFSNFCWKQRLQQRAWILSTW